MTNWILWGTLVNTATVVLGATLGLTLAYLLRRAAKRRAGAPDVGEAADAAPQKDVPLSDAVIRALGLCVLLIGIKGALQISNVLVMIVSIALGTLIGELLHLDDGVNRFGKWVEGRTRGNTGRVAEGFVTATMVFCVGAMTVTGAIESGMERRHDTYYAKALLDLVSSTVLASSLGVGVLLSAAGLFAFQSVLTLIAFFLAGAIPLEITGEMMAVGSLLVMGLGTNLMGITRLKVMNMLPAMLLPLALCPLFSLL